MERKVIDGQAALEVDSRSAWRSWLSMNHDKISEIWLVLKKKTSGKQFMTKLDALDDALCFGWIDSLVKAIDTESYMQKFTPRKAGSQWSETNKKRAVYLESQGLMEPPGQKLIERAKASGEWALNRDNPKIVRMPSHLKVALTASPLAQSKWEQLAPSHQYKYKLWIASAKREETRANRTNKTIKMLISGQSPSML